MLEELKKETLKANLDLLVHGLVLFTWGNASVFDEETGLMVIKPSGVSYDAMTYEDMTVVDLDGNKVEGRYNPSSDTATHIELYKAFRGVKCIVHTHSKWATAWAQALFATSAATAVAWSGSTRCPPGLSYRGTIQKRTKPFRSAASIGSFAWVGSGYGPGGLVPSSATCIRIPGVS